MNKYFADLHIHLGRSPWGGPIKISAAKGMTASAVMSESVDRKGLDIIGIVDAQTRGGWAEIKRLLDEELLEEHPEGGFTTDGGDLPGPLTLIPGAEMETVERHEGGGGQAHWLIFVRGVRELDHLRRWYEAHVTNADLSSQRVQATAADLQALAAEVDGLFMPAHAFTPFKSLYGRCAASWEQVLPHRPHAVELGLSADSSMADRMEELHPISFLSNSDAHSIGKIAREYNELRLKKPTFEELKKALARTGGRKVAANYGLEPRLGKYYRSHCRVCGTTVSEDPPVMACPACGEEGSPFVAGVVDRLAWLTRRGGDAGGDGGPGGDAEAGEDDQAGEDPGSDDDEAPGRSPHHRPPYIHQVPLEFIPGLGPATYRKLLEEFGTEMAVLHEAGRDHLARAVGDAMAETIVLARSGRMAVEPGGGGIFGRISRSDRPAP